MSYFVTFIGLALDTKYKPMLISQTIIDLYTRTVRHSINWFDSHLSGEISNKISDFQNSLTMLVENLFWSFGFVVNIIVTLCFLWQVNVFAALMMLVFILVYAPTMYWLLKKQVALRKYSVRSKQEAIGVVNDSISNIVGIKIVGAVLEELRLKLKPAVLKWQAGDKKARVFETYFIYNADVGLALLMMCIQVYFLAHLYQVGNITAGGFTFIVTMNLKLYAQLSLLLSYISASINPSIAQAKASYEFVSAAVDVKDVQDAYPLKQVHGHISFNDVDASYSKNGKLVLSKFNLKIKPGEHLGIVGSSGAGKTTLIKCLLRYFDISSGSIFIDKHDIKNVTLESLRNAMSIIPQDFTLLHRSIRDNLKLAKSEAADKEIIIACQKANIHNDIIKMPEGYDTIVGERGIKLSGGQRQRIALARAILKNAPILILDEATSSLDIATEQLIHNSINELLKTNNATVVAISHRLSSIKHMDRIIVLDQGKIAEEGTHDELLRKKDGLYKRLWEMQSV